MTRGILPDIVERHADEAAFLWCQRHRGSRSPLFDLAALRDWDERLDANLEGLTLAGTAALELCQRDVDREIDGAVFGAAYVAAQLGDAMAFAKLAVATESSEAAARQLIDAIRWLPAQVADRVLGEMADERAPVPLQRLALRAYVVRGGDPGALWTRALASEDEALRDAALWAAGPLGREEMRKSLKDHYRGQETSDAALWAASAALLLGEKQAAAALWQYLDAHLPGADPAQRERLALACRYACHGAAAGSTTPGSVTSESAERLSALANRDDTRELALIGAAALGDPACIAFVLPMLQDPVLARRAAWAYASITGVTLQPPLATRVPMDAPNAEEVARRARSPIEDLPLPSHDDIATHWEEVRGDYDEGQRYLGGRPLSPEHMQHLLEHGLQPWRHECAIALSYAGLRRPLFDVSAPSPQQLRMLAGLGAAS